MSLAIAGQFPLRDSSCANTKSRIGVSIPDSVAKSCLDCKQHFARGAAYDWLMPRTPVREVLARNLEALMERRPDLDTQIKVAKKSGISQTSVSQILNPENEQMESPKLNQVEKIARAFGLATWQLLLDPATVGKELAELLMRPAVQDDDKRLAEWTAKEKSRENDNRSTTIGGNISGRAGSR